MSRRKPRVIVGEAWVPPSLPFRALGVGPAAGWALRGPEQPCLQAFWGPECRSQALPWVSFDGQMDPSNVPKGGNEPR